MYNQVLAHKGILSAKNDKESIHSDEVRSCHENVASNKEEIHALL